MRINQSPSCARRKALRDADESCIFTILNSYSIEKYYDAADRLLETFRDAINQREFDDAYILGLRFGTFSLEALPKHADYSKVRYKNFRIRNAKQVKEVLQKVEHVTEIMDIEERIKRKKNIQKEEKNKEEIEVKQGSICMRYESEQLKKEKKASFMLYVHATSLSKVLNFLTSFQTRSCWGLNMVAEEQCNKDEKIRDAWEQKEEKKTSLVVHVHATFFARFHLAIQR